MASAACELTLLRQLFQQLKLKDIQEIRLICDNQVVLHIASNLVFMKGPNTEIDCHFVGEKVPSGEIVFIPKST